VLDTRIEDGADRLQEEEIVMWMGVEGRGDPKCSPIETGAAN